MSIYKVGIVGGGVMGRGIAQTCALNGDLPVVVKELNKELAERSHLKIQKTLDDLVQRGKSKALIAKDLVSVTDDWRDFSDVDLLIEAVVENMEEKQKVFSEVAFWLPINALMVSNTSALPLGKMMQKVNSDRHAKFAGLHFFNPPHQLKLVELVHSENTSDETMAELEDFSKNTIGRIVVKVKECPGFLVNRLLAPYLNEAVWLLMETTLTPHEIDNEAQAIWPMGPFTLMDMLGIDVCAEAAKAMHAGYGARMEPSPLTNKLVELKRFGIKSGAGFYGDPGVVEIIEKNFPYSRQLTLPAQEGFQRMMLAFVNEAFLCLGDGVASADDIETGCREGLGFSPVLQGPLHWAEKMGLGKVFDKVLTLQKLGNPRFIPSTALAAHGTGLKKLEFASDADEF